MGVSWPGGSCCFHPSDATATLHKPTGSLCTVICCSCGCHSMQFLVSGTSPAVSWQEPSSGTAGGSVCSGMIQTCVPLDRLMTDGPGVSHWLLQAKEKKGECVIKTQSTFCTDHSNGFKCSVNKNTLQNIFFSLKFSSSFYMDY